MLKISYKKINKVSFLFLLAYLVVVIVPSEIALFSFLKFSLSLVLFFLFGLNISNALAVFIKGGLDGLENISIAIVSIFVFLPSLVFAFQYLFGFYVNALTALAMFVVFLINYFIQKNKNGFLCLRPKKITNEYFIGFFILSIVFLINIFLYSHLPDLDPYGWIIKTKSVFNELKPSFFRGRELYVVFSQVHSDFLGISIFNVFKYVYPLYSILIIFPLSLVARNFKSFWHRLIILVFGLVSPTVILAFGTAMPQIIWLISFYFIIAFLIYYEQTKKDIFFIIPGIISFITVFYHVGSSIIFFFWAIFAIYKYRKVFIKNKAITILLGIILISNIDLLQRLSHFLFKFSSKAWRMMMDGSANFLFPAYYNNIDGAEMGWAGFSGVLKYYSFYAGPVVFVIAGFFIGLLINKEFRVFLKNKFKRNKPVLGIGIIICTGVLLFVLAEILPRLFSVAFLPDRVWVFLAPCFIILLIPIYKFFEKNSKYKTLGTTFNILLIAALLISVSGAIYVNWQKSYLITKEQKEAAKWMKETLPSKPIVLSSGNRNVITHNADMEYIKVDLSFYQDTQELERLLGSEIKEKIKSDFLKYRKMVYETLEGGYSYDDEIKEAKMSALKVGIRTEEFLKKEGLRNDSVILRDNLVNNHRLFVFYSPPNENNPYLNRPYSNGTQWSFEKESGFIQDSDHRFKRIYNKDGIIIWEMNL